MSVSKTRSGSLGISYENVTPGRIIFEVDGVDEETGGRFIKFPENITCLNSMNELLDKYGEIPLPPYIKNSEEESFHEKSYQTEYATNPGAVAAPTAGLHLSKSLISNLKKKGVIILPITLHVGYGTFKPIDQEDLSNLKLHKEWVSVNKEVVEEIKRIKKTDRKIIEQIIRVDHAGERGAIKIYEGQLLALNTIKKNEKLKSKMEKLNNSSELVLIFKYALKDLSRNYKKISSIIMA